MRNFLLKNLMLFGFAVLVTVYIQGDTHAQDYSADVATTWFELQLKLVQETPGFTPPVASRAFGYSAVALYESIVPGMPEYQSLAGQLNALEALPQPEPNLFYDWPTVANSALATITRRLYPTATEENQSAINALEAGFNTSVSHLNPVVISRSIAHGQAVAEAVYTWSLTDGGHEGYKTNFNDQYQPPAGIGFWVSTPRSNGDPQSALQPFWGDNRPFVLESGAECMAAEHPLYSEDEGSDIYAEAWEVYTVSQELTADQQEIALFWADDPGKTATPPGHSISILTQILQAEEASLGFAAEAYARMGIAVNDAFIGCWNAKYVYNLLRPVSYIQQMIDETWLPIIDTPPFPEYPSGHSVQSGAAAVVLNDLFGENYHFVDHTHDALGLAPRTFASFDDLAAEAAISRLYGGIHYRAAIELGLDQGRCIGEQVEALQFHRDV